MTEEQLTWIKELGEQHTKQIRALEHKIKMLENSIKNPTAPKLPYGRYFMLEWSDDEEAELIWFGDTSEKADDSPPREIYKEMERILRPVFGINLFIENQEGQNSVACSKQEHGKIYWKIKELLEANGWSESTF